MAQRAPTIGFDKVALDEARHMSRGPRMTPELCATLKQHIPLLNTTATRMTIPETTTPTTTKNRILHVAGALGMPAMVRKIPGGLLFWRSTDEEL